MTLTSFSRSLLYKVSVNDCCVHPISWIIRWNLFKLAQILHWDEGKKWLDFGDCTSFSRSHWHFETQILIEKSLCDILISIRCTYIRESKDKEPILLELLPFVKFLNAVKSLCAHYMYLFNQWMEFDQTSTGTSSGWGKEVIRFWWPWPYFQGHYIINTQKLALCALYSFSCISWLI